MKNKKFLLWIIIACLLMSCSSLVESTGEEGAAVVLAQDGSTTGKESEDVEVARPEGWSEETHNQSADLNYDIVFPQDKVNRIDLVIDPEDWQAMLDNMTELYGEAGSRQDRGGGGRMPRGGDMPQGGKMPQGGEMPQEGAVPQGGEIPQEGAMPQGRGIPQEGGEPPEGWTLPEGVMPQEGEMPQGEEALPEGAMPPGQDRRMPGENNMPGNRPQMGGGGPGGGMMDSSVNPIYVPVTVEFEDNTWTYVGMRFKGNSSLMSTWNSGNMKLPFRLDFDEFEEEYPEIDDQRFYGFKQLAFSSNFSDESYLREKVTADIFRAAGVPSAQTAFYEVYIDYGEGPIYFGLYTLCEIVDDTVIQTQFADDSGNVYKPEGTGASFAAGTFNEDAFEKQNHEDEADWSDVLAVFDVLHADTRMSDPATWRSELEAVFDVDGFLNWLAVNTVVQNWDTYGAMAHNYYLYHDPTTDKIVWIPWDNNMALSANMGHERVASLDHQDVGENWPLLRYLLDDDTYYAQYVDYVDAVINSAFDPTQMEAIYRALAALVEPYVLSENAEHTTLKSDESFYDGIESLVEHAYARYDAAAEFVAEQP